MHVILKILGLHVFLPGHHLVHISPDGVDLPVVDNESVGVGPHPAGRFLSERRREELAEKVKNLSSDVASLEEWNDALLYLTGCGPEETVKEAQSRLAEQLRTPEED